MDSPDSLKEKDLKRLKSVKDENSEIRTFFLLVSENKLPSKFVDETTGIALRKISFGSGEYEFDALRAVCALKSKIQTGALKRKINQHIKSSDNPETEINGLLDGYMKKHFSSGVYVCLVEVFLRINVKQKSSY